MKRKLLDDVSILGYGHGDFFIEFLYNIEKKGFKASFTPMIGVNDLGVTDYESDGGEKISTNFLSEFAAINGKINPDAFPTSTKTVAIKDATTT